MWREQDAERRAIIVHPRYRLDARQPPPPASVPPPDWHALPLEVVSLIAAHLELPHDVLRLSATCRDTRYLASCNRIWRQLCLRRFAVPDGSAAAAARQEGFWLSLYKFNHHVFTSIIGRSSAAGRPGGGAFGGRQGPLVIQLS